MDKFKIDFIEKVRNCLRSFNFCEDVAYWIACQFALESSFGRSSLAINYHNYCGMKLPMVRISCAENAQNSDHTWARYFDLTCCVCDYVLCLQYHKPLSTNYDNIKHFSAFISKFYCPERTYIDRINQIYSQFKSLKS